MKVSVVVPVKDNEEMIGDCIESLLNQDFPKTDYEVIVVDNNSRDNTAKEIKRHPVKYLFEERIGVSFALNKGVNESSGPIIAFTDSDCLADRKWLGELVKVFKEKNVASVAGEVIGFTPTATVVEQFLASYNNLSQGKNFDENGDPKGGYFPVYVVTANVAYKKNILVKLGMFDTQMRSGHDVDLSWRVQWAGYKIAFSPEALIYHRYRRGVFGMFKKFFGYSYHRSLYLKKHRKELNKRIFFARYRYNSLLKNMVLMIPFLILKRGKEEKLKLVFQNIVDIAEITGSIFGSLKNRVVVL